MWLGDQRDPAGGHAGNQVLHRPRVAAARRLPVAHLGRRLLASLSRRGPTPEQRSWAHDHLTASERGLWDRQAAVDRRHSCRVAERACAGFGVDAVRPVAAAALLHDVGKVEARLGVVGRVVATIMVPRWGSRLAAGGRLGRYRDYPALGSRLLADAGSDPLVVAWAREHHWPEERWSVPLSVGRALQAADR